MAAPSAPSAWPALAALALGLAACSVPSTAFRATPDAGSAGPDARAGVLAIEASAASLDVNEGATASFSVTLSQAPGAELVVRVASADTASAAAIGLSTPELRFEPNDFDQPQTVTVTGLVDADTADALASITLSADGVDPVTVAATVRDHDKVEIATDIAANGTLVINETSTATVHVHLTHQPAADVRLTAALGTGPVTVLPAEVTFTPANYNVDQAFTFTAPDDINIISEDESLTFQATGAPDKPCTIHDVDKDALNIHATPTTLSVNESGSAQISVTLTKQPPANTTVHVDVQLGNVTVDHTDLTFTPQNFATAQTITVSAPQDNNTVNEQDQVTLSIPGSTVSSVTVAVTTIDDDVQAIIENAPSPLSVTENQSTTFGVTLKFQPTTTMFVTVSSLDGSVATASPGTLTFTAQDYNDPTKHQVTVHGTDDNNLVANATSIKLHEPTLVDVLAQVNVPDDDTQQIVVSPSSLSIPEGMSSSFSVSLKFDPGTTVSVNLANTNQTSLPINPLGTAAITFTGGPGGSWSTPVPVTVHPPVDGNAVAETATVTVSGGGAPTPATVALSVTDSTVVQNWGWPTPFAGMTQVPANAVYAYQVSVGAVANLSTFHAYLPGAAGTYTMALYSDAGGVPGNLVANGAMLVPKAGVTGVNDSDLLAMPPQLNAPLYWIAIRFSQTNTIGYATAPPGGTGQKGKQCVRNIDLDLSLPWPGTFSSAMCQTDFLFNLWITTFHQ
ncbi:MAG TPA: hypothetical protein VHW23_29275 [Kofleriaceae bacterium]|nr:hypothetical protein [Kofleriaceae bacterium]